MLVYRGSSGAPSLHLVTAEDDLAAQDLADQLLTQMADGVGVEVWRDDQRIHARGAAPARKRD